MIDRAQMEAMKKRAAQIAAAKHEPAIRRSVQESSQLSSELWNDPRCQAEVEQLVGDLLQPGIMELFAIHEAGHEIYYRRAGFTTFSFDSPRVIFDEKSSTPFNRQRARIKPGCEWIQPEGDWLRKLARGYAAGGRSSVRLSKWKIAGDTSDRTNWGDMYASRFPEMERNDAMEKEIEQMWSDAQGDVNKDLENEVFQEEVHDKAREIMPQLYPWLPA